MRHARWILMAALMLSLAVLACDSEPTYVPPKEPPPPPEDTERVPEEPPVTGPAMLSITSNPPGARVVVGIQSVGGVYDTSTGRFVGTTPLTVELSDSDVSYTNGNGNLVIELSLDGYFPSMQLIGVGSGLEPGRTYELDVTLNPLS
jgi:hypothetical protein